MTIHLSDTEPPADVIPNNIISVDFEKSKKEAEEKKRREIIDKICAEAKEIKW